MKEAPLSNCERSFIEKAITEGRRLDGRRLTEYRPVEILFGTEYGLCQVSIGETRVLAQVSCEIQQPKTTRPNEGLLHINVGLSPMGAPHFEVGRQSDTSIHLNRLIEKCIKDSKCIDLESLCIVAEEKVWMIRVDLNILNHEGNLTDCASIAALAALSHFRRPDVELQADELVIFEHTVRDPIPLTVRHHPLCVSFAIFNSGQSIAVDPSQMEEKIAEALLTLGVNGYSELCGVYLLGSAQTGPELVRQCSAKAAARAVELVALIKKTLAEDNTARANRNPIGFAEIVRQGRITALGIPSIRLPQKTHVLPVTMEVDEPRSDGESMDKEPENDVSVIQSIGPGTAQLGDPACMEEHVSDDASDLSSESETKSIEMVEELTAEQKRANKNVQDVVLSGDSEEEETVILVSEHRPARASASASGKKRKGKLKKRH